MVDDLGGTQEHASPLLGGQQFNRPGRIAIGHEYDSPHASAYGTDHPVDIKLGRAAAGPIWPRRPRVSPGRRVRRCTALPRSGPSRSKQHRSFMG